VEDEDQRERKEGGATFRWPMLTGSDVHDATSDSTRRRGSDMRPWSYRYDQGRIAIGGGFGYARAVRPAAGQTIVPPEPSSTAPHDTEFVARRESVRRRLLRANTAVAVLIASTAVLAMSALWQSLRATKLQASAVANQQRAETAEGQARSELWRALLTEARATRRGPSMTRRSETLEALQRAAAIAPVPELRHEAIAALALPEDRVEATVPLDAAVRAYDFDAALRQTALGLTNGDVVLYQLPDAKVSRRLRLADGPIPASQGAVVGLSFSPDGAALAVRYNRGALAVWDLGSGRMRFVRDADQIRRPASRGLFSSDGAVLVAPVFTPDGFAAMNARTGETLRHFGQFSSFHHCAVRPGATQFAVYADELVSVMDWQTGGKAGEYPYPEGARVLEWSADGRQLAIAGASLHVQVQDVARGTRTFLSGPKDSVVNLHFDPTGQHLAAVTADRASMLWKLPETRPVGVYEGRRFVRWGPSGVAGWAVPRERLELRRPVSNPAYAKLAGVPDQAEGDTMDVSADGHWAVTRAFPDGLLVWNLEQPAPPEFVALTNVQSLCFHSIEPKLFLLRGHRLEVRDATVVVGDGRRSLALGAPSVLSGVSNRLTGLVTSSAEGGTRAYVELKSGRV
jgi:WD40 repeat protein